MHFFWRPDWTRNVDDYEGAPPAMSFNIRDDNLAIVLYELHILGACLQSLRLLSANTRLSQCEVTRKHHALVADYGRYGAFDRVSGLVAEGADPSADEPQILHPDAPPEDAACGIGLWRGAIVIHETFIEAQQIVGQGTGAVDVHEMQLGAAIELRQKPLDATVARHLTKCGRAVDVEDHLEASVVGEQVRIVIVPPPLRRQAIYRVD